MNTPSFSYSLSVVLFCTFVAFSTFYAPQPLLPLISTNFAVSPTATALLITIPFLALCFAPLFYGALLQHSSARNLMILSITLLALMQWWFASAETFTTMLLSRTAQALLYPATFTAAVTYCSQCGSKDKVASRVSLYIAMTIGGGLFGRLASGYITSWFDWQLVFKLAAFSLLLCGVALIAVKPDIPAGGSVNSNSLLRSIISTPTFLWGYLLIFSSFFAFSAILNALPFRLVEIDPEITPARISLVYSGYLAGILIATNTTRLSRWLGGRVRAMIFALVFFVCGLLLSSIAQTWWLVAMSFLTASGMFLIHATLSGFLTSLQPHHASVINGLYIAIYYAAGALGSILPLLIYRHFGWTWFVVAIALAASAGFVSLKRLSLISQRHLNREST